MEKWVEENRRYERKRLLREEVYENIKKILLTEKT